MKIQRVDTTEVVADSITLSQGEIVPIVVELAPGTDRPESYKGLPVSEPRQWPMLFRFYPIQEGPDSSRKIEFGSEPVFYPNDVHVGTFGNLGPPERQDELPNVREHFKKSDFPEDVIPHFTYLYSNGEVMGDCQLDVYIFPCYHQATATTWMPGELLLIKSIPVRVEE